jgi:hypothetical protein
MNESLDGISTPAVKEVKSVRGDNSREPNWPIKKWPGLKYLAQYGRQLSMKMTQAIT